MHIRVIVIDAPESKPLYKASLPDDVAKSYEAIALVDSDVAWVKSPDSLFALVQDKMLVSRLNFRLSNDAYNKNQLTAAEKMLKAAGGLIDPATRSCNTGTIFFPGSQYAAYAAAWKTAWDVAKKPSDVAAAQGFDQPVLQALMVRGAIKYDYLPDNAVVFPVSERFTLPTDVTVLAHFAGYPSTDAGNQACLAAMKAYPEKLAILAAARAPKVTAE